MIAVNMKFENFQATLPNNKSFDLYEYLGDSNGLILFFRGSWCGHCKKQLLDLKAHENEFDSLDIKLIAISNEDLLKTSLLENFLKLSFPLIPDPDFVLINRMNLQTSFRGAKVAKPSVFIVSEDRDILYKYIGEDYDDRLSAIGILESAKEVLQKYEN